MAVCESVLVGGLRRCTFTRLQGRLCHHDDGQVFLGGGTWVSSLSPGLCRYPGDICIFMLNKCPPHGLVERTKGAHGMDISM